ncbi:MAG: exo-alpha-sialidase [Roseibium sp.]|uniref:sialidase family protein n=1 Tax=Roseibium sp. TaxID=1936156 RepID=UPI001B1DBD03|nr:sialidase family protein [Roseibium sp.]MBO6895224.1 exo-alpha-sialidase [Roseibium sp.]MBO6930734.1 exo-alpha-sialidase [Roseibium sp.]
MSQPYPLPRETRSSGASAFDGLTAVYGPFDFKIFDLEDVAVYIKHAGEDSYTRTDAVTVTKTTGLPYDTFSVAFDTVHPATSSYIVRGERTPERSAAVVKGGGIDTAALEKELSKIAVEGQELRRDVLEAIRVQVGTPGAMVGDIPAGHAIVMGEDGNLVSGGSLLLTDFRGGWSAIETYTRGSQVSKGNKLFFLAADTSLGEDPELGDPWQLVQDFDQLSLVPDDASLGNAKLADMSTQRLKGRLSDGSGAPEDLDPADVRRMLDIAPYPRGQVPYLSSTVDSGSYEHFPVQSAGPDKLGVLYKRGPQHNSAHDTAVASAQSFSSGGTQLFSIDGALASGGVAAPPQRTKVRLVFSADETGRTFTISGTLNSVPVLENVSGGAAGTVVDTVSQFDEVDGAQTDDDTAGTVSIGFRMVPQNLSFKWTKTGGASWSDRIDVFDGDTDQRVYYWGALGAMDDGSFIALASECDIPTETYRALMKPSPDGEDWSAPAVEINVTGDVPSVVEFFGDVQKSPSGRLFVGAYDGDESFVMYSDDRGANWVSRRVILDGAQTHSEITPVMLDEKRGIAITRIDNLTGSLVQSKTLDGGDTWTDMGQTNLPVTGGYKSHDLSTIWVDGIQYIVMTYMIRDSGSAPADNPDTIALVFVEAEKALTSADNWSQEKTIVTGVEDLSGYPSLWIHPQSGIGLLAYGQETTYYYAAQVLTKRIDVADLIKQDTWTPVLTAVTPGDLAVTYSAQRGEVVRNGKLITAFFEIVTSAFTHTTASGALTIDGLPNQANADGQTLTGSLEWSGITRAGYTQLAARVGPNGKSFLFRASGSAKNASNINITDLPTGGSVRLIGVIHYRAK